MNKIYVIIFACLITRTLTAPLSPTQASEFNTLSIVGKTQEWVDQLPQNIHRYLIWKHSHPLKLTFFTNTDDTVQKNEIWSTWVEKCRENKRACMANEETAAECLKQKDVDPYSNREMSQYEPIYHIEDDKNQLYHDYITVSEIKYLNSLGELQTSISVADIVND